MSYQHKNKLGSYCVTLPDDWEVDVAKTGTSFFDNDGVGIITISTYSKTNTARNPCDYVMNFIPSEVVNIAMPVVVYIPSAFSTDPIAFAEYTYKGDAWRVWCISLKETMIVISYNCDHSTKGIEDRTVDAIVSSIRSI